MNDNYDARVDDLARKAANPNEMGDCMKPTNGTPMEDPQMRDMNHPQGSGNHRPGIETAG